MSRLGVVLVVLIAFFLGALVERETAEKEERRSPTFAVRRIGVECKYVGREPYAVIVEHGDGSLTLQSGAATTTVHSEYHRDADSFLTTLNNLQDWRCKKATP